MAPFLSVALLLLAACGGPRGAAGAGEGAFLARTAQGVQFDECGCKIGEEGWSTTIQACRPESQTSPEEAAACMAESGQEEEGAAAGVDACGCKVGAEGWSSTIQRCRAGSETSEEEAAACAEAATDAADEDLDECGCRAGEGWSSTVQKCRRESETSAEEVAACASAGNETTASSPCLCVFDIDRTLTGKQADTMRCPNNKVLYGLWDKAYGGGIATLSDLAVQGIDKTFCDKCYLGICSAGGGSGAGSRWNNYILDNIMRSEMQDELTARDPSIKSWSYGTNVQSPYVLYQGNKVKQDAVEGIRVWYGQRGIRIAPQSVYMFGDRTENMPPFADYHMNSQEISCGSRDWELYGGSGMVGYCGATVEEVRRAEGNHVCARP